MRKTKEQLIVSKEDHQLIMDCIKTGRSRSTLSRQEAQDLETELNKATLVERHKLPEDVVCLNATVTIQEEKAGKVMELTLVTPEKADIRQRRVSILAPIAAALIGFRKGKKVAWKVPAGLKTFCILEVRKPLEAAV
jgi:regulator of nucleoside diphosphate kinase